MEGIRPEVDGMMEGFVRKRAVSLVGGSGDGDRLLHVLFLLLVLLAMRS